MNNKDKISVIIVDDHQLIRDGFTKYINEDNELKLLAEAENGEEGIKKIRMLKPDVAVIDIELSEKGINGLLVAKQIINEKLKTEIVMYTGKKEEEYFDEAMALDVSGYVYKDEKPDELLNAIKRVYIGETYVSKIANKYLIDLYKRRGRFRKNNVCIDLLTKKELEILKLVSDNKSNKEIASDLIMAVRTVETHRKNICDKLNLKGKNKLLVFALQNRHLI
jgi:DNA-binding NarL/FixJ family response regulator